MPALDDSLRRDHAALKARDEWRMPQVTTASTGPWMMRDGKEYLSFAGNDYLGLSHHPSLLAAAREAAEAYGTGAGASPLVTGRHPLMEQLENALAAFKGTEAACLFGSGYLANIGTIPALVEEGDLILADKRIHACLVDGARLSGAKFLRFRHNDVPHLARLMETHRANFRRCLIVVDGVYSMDGDRAPLDKLSALAKIYDAWLMVDDAHGFGVLGQGKGTAHEWNPLPEVDIQMGTFSKAAGSYGGYVAGSHALIETLHNKARSLIFSTALPPSVIAASRAALTVIREDRARVEKPLALARYFTNALALPEAQSAIVPLIVKSSAAALALSAKAKEAGFLLPAIRPPTVPPNSARLRITFSALHERHDIDRLIAFLHSEAGSACAA